MSVEDHQISFSLEINVEKAYQDVRRVQTILYRVAGLMRRMGLSENVDAAMAKLQQIQRMVNSLRLAYAALQAARMAAGDPIAWAMAGVAIATTAFDAGDLIMEAGS